MEKSDRQIEAEALATMARAMDIDLGKGRTLYYDVLDPDPDDLNARARMFVTVARPTDMGLVGMFGLVSMECIGFTIPIEPAVMRNMLVKWLAKLDEKYPADIPEDGPGHDAEWAEGQAWEAARCGLPK